MLRYEPKDIQITFREIPECICLPINIYGCTIHCPECFEKYLWNKSSKVGKELNFNEIRNIYKDNPGADCICFMGGMDLLELTGLAYSIKHYLKTYDGKEVKVAWYTGYDELPSMIRSNLELFNYIKLGHYDSKFGPMNKRTTNQHLYRVDYKPEKVMVHDQDWTDFVGRGDNESYKLTDITKEMWIGQP